MSSPTQNPFDLLLDQFRAVVAEEIAKALANGASHTAEKDALLTPEQAAAIIGVNKKWLYRHARQLPFTRLSRKKIRFNESGLRRWLAAKK